MAIITISRGSYSKGREVAERVAAELGYRCISRDVLLEASEHFRVPEIKLVRAIHDAPSILERLTRSREEYITYIRWALARAIKEDNVVYHGLAGHVLLRGIPHVLRVRVIAELDARVKAEAKREQISLSEARAILLRDDRERRKWTRSLYGLDPWDSSLYDLVVHIDRLTVEDAASLICEAASREQFVASKVNQRKVNDFIIACEVKSSLVRLQEELRVSCEHGNIIVYLKGADKQDQRQKKRIMELTEGIEGINNIEIHSVRSFPPQAV